MKKLRKYLTENDESILDQTPLYLNRFFVLKKLGLHQKNFIKAIIIREKLIKV